MKKANPLFVDSTKMSGDTVATKVELRGITPFDGELIQVKVTERSGDQQSVDLERKDDTLVTGYIILHHQQEFVYEFTVSRMGEILHKTEPKSIRAFYVLEEDLSYLQAGWKAAEIEAGAQLEAKAQAEVQAQVEAESAAKAEAEAVLNKGPVPEQSNEELVLDSQTAEPMALQTASEIEEVTATEPEEIFEAQEIPDQAPTADLVPFAATSEEQIAAITNTDTDTDSVTDTDTDTDTELIPISAPESESGVAYKELAHVIQQAAQMMKDFSDANLPKKGLSQSSDETISSLEQVLKIPPAEYPLS